MAKLVRTLLTPFRVAGFFPFSGTGESNMTATVSKKATANPKAKPVDAATAFELAMRRYPTIIARLAK